MERHMKRRHPKSKEYKDFLRGEHSIDTEDEDNEEICSVDTPKANV